MIHFRYLIVGGGMAADAAAHGIRERDAKGSIGLVGEEPHPPYNRPPLSKGLYIFGKVDEARALLSDPKVVSADSVRGRIVKP